MNYSKDIIDQVWEMAFIIEGENPNKKRKDKCGATIERNAYGTETKYGWQINHIHPLSAGGFDFITNYQPLHWENHLDKADGPDFPHVYCVRRH